jgi:ferredoxin
VKFTLSLLGPIYASTDNGPTCKACDIGTIWNFYVPHSEHDVVARCVACGDCVEFCTADARNTDAVELREILEHVLSLRS